MSKKGKSKSHGGASKRLKLSKGGDAKKGKLLVKVVNRAHRMIKKSRERVLKGKKSTVLSDIHDKYRSVL